MPVSSMQEKLLKRALEWFFLLQSEHCSDEDRQRFDRWYQASEANRAAYQNAEKLWSQLDQLKNAAELPELFRTRQSPYKKRAVRALGISVLLLAASLLITAGWSEYQSETLTYTTRLGERQEIILTDGSMVKLNTDTRLHARISLLSRTLQLERGEVWFDVQHEWLRPFIVETGKLKIRDIGTQFNVRLGNIGLQSETSTVAVLQGAVEINGERLGEGYQHTYRSFPDGNRQIVQQVIDIEQVEAWQHDRLIFRQTSLHDVAIELQRYHPIRFVFADTALADKTISGSFAANDLALFLEGLEKILPVKVTQIPREQLIRLDWRKTR
ncbi:MAG: FecR domain-containing protein [Nitrosomonas sp.]|jgi:transmembrane sensor|nr:FecR domain-containing protein [Nitrosomonas sp.]